MLGKASRPCHDVMMRVVSKPPRPTDMTPISVRRGLSLACAGLLLCAAPLLGQSKQPPPPKEYDVQVRFRIRQPMPQWLDRFDEMLGSFKRFGFVRDEPPEDEPKDPEVDPFTGRRPSGSPR